MTWTVKQLTLVLDETVFNQHIMICTLEYETMRLVRNSWPTSTVLMQNLREAPASFVHLWCTNVLRLYVKVELKILYSRDSCVKFSNASSG